MDSAGHRLRQIARENALDGTYLRDALEEAADRIDSLELRLHRLEVETLPREVEAA